MKKLYNFAEYNTIFENKQNNHLYILVITFIIGIIYFICTFQLCIYQNVVLFKNENTYKLISQLTLNNDISTSKKIIINNKKYNFKNISEDYLETNGTIYRITNIKIKNYNDSNKILKCKFMIKKATLIDILIEYLQGG